LTDDRTILPGDRTVEGTVVPSAVGAHAGLLEPGMAIGPFTITRMLGEGGFGVVYEAEQLKPVRRSVALKVLKPGMDNGEVLMRFEGERQALARMEHPCIAKVLDAGIGSDGRPYFAMELVRGEPLLAFADRERLTVAERVELMIRVCEAIQHAHAKGVVHRDLKPANILCVRTESGLFPKVIDFGIAKATADRLSDSTMMTMGGALMGTPDYMSPEQADGTDVDTRADVYSLGVALYELLSGLLPFDPAVLRGHGISAMRERILSEIPSRPSARLRAAAVADPALGACIATARATNIDALVRALREDIDWICLRCLEKERDRRYASPGDIAADLRRHLQRRPVLAGPPSNAYVARRFVSRHRFGVGTAAALVAILAGGLVTFAHLYRETEKQRKAASDTLQAFQESIAAVDPSTGRSTAAMGALDFLLLVEDELGSRLDDQPDALASMRSSLGLARLGFKDGDGARRLFSQAVETRRAAVLARPGLQSDRELADALHNLARAFYYGKDMPGARELYREALALRRKVHGNDDHAEVAMTLQHLAATERQLGNAEEAMQLIDDSVAMWTRLAPDSRERYQAINNRGTVLQQLGRLDDAERDYLSAIDVCRRAGRTDDPLLARMFMNLGRVRVRAERHADARPAFEEAVRIYRLKFGDDDPDTRSALAAVAELDAH
jgi:serine/threonine protein kinase/Tfp pilus assembly protein PilF